MDASNDRVCRLVRGRQQEPINKRKFSDLQLRSDFRAEVTVSSLLIRIRSATEVSSAECDVTRPKWLDAPSKVRSPMRRRECVWAVGPMLSLGQRLS